MCAKTDAKFIISSDAHRPEDVGNLRLALIRAKEAHLDLERIVNLARVKI
jgi:putative hydrolase